MQERVALAQMVDHEILAGLDHDRRQELDLLRNMGEVLEGVEEQGTGGAQEGSGPPGQDGAVLHLHGGGGTAGLLVTDVGGHDDRPVAHGDLGLVHEQLDLLGGFL